MGSAWDSIFLAEQECPCRSLTHNSNTCREKVYSGTSIIQTPLVTGVWIRVRIIEIAQITKINSIIVVHAQLNVL